MLKSISLLRIMPYVSLIDSLETDEVQKCVMSAFMAMFFGGMAKFLCIDLCVHIYLISEPHASIGCAIWKKKNYFF
jgi:hypothetical protein